MSKKKYKKGYIEKITRLLRRGGFGVLSVKLNHNEMMENPIISIEATKKDKG